MFKKLVGITLLVTYSFAAWAMKNPKYKSRGISIVNQIREKYHAKEKEKNTKLFFALDDAGLLNMYAIYECTAQKKDSFACFDVKNPQMFSTFAEWVLTIHENVKPSENGLGIMFEVTTCEDNKLIIRAKEVLLKSIKTGKIWASIKI